MNSQRSFSYIQSLVFVLILNSFCHAQPYTVDLPSNQYYIDAVLLSNKKIAVLSNSTEQVYIHQITPSSQKLLLITFPLPKDSNKLFKLQRLVPINDSLLAVVGVWADKKSPIHSNIAISIQLTQINLQTSRIDTILQQHYQDSICNMLIREIDNQTDRPFISYAKYQDQLYLSFNSHMHRLPNDTSSSTAVYLAVYNSHLKTLQTKTFLSQASGSGFLLSANQSPQAILLEDTVLVVYHHSLTGLGNMFVRSKITHEMELERIDSIPVFTLSSKHLLIPRSNEFIFNSRMSNNKNDAEVTRVCLRPDCSDSLAGKWEYFLPDSFNKDDNVLMRIAHEYSMTNNHYLFIHSFTNLFTSHVTLSITNAQLQEIITHELPQAFIGDGHHVIVPIGNDSFVLIANYYGAFNQIGNPKSLLISANSKPVFTGLSHHNAPASSLKMYPNPARDILYISKSDFPYMVLISAIGKQYISVCNGDNTYDLSSIPSGFYTVLSNSGQHVGKLLIDK